MTSRHLRMGTIRRIGENCLGMSAERHRMADLCKSKEVYKTRNALS